MAETGTGRSCAISASTMSRKATTAASMVRQKTWRRLMRATSVARAWAAITSSPAARARSAASPSGGRTASAGITGGGLFLRRRRRGHALLHLRHGRRQQLLHRQRECGWRLLRQRRAQARAAIASGLAAVKCGGALSLSWCMFLCWRWWSSARERLLRWLREGAGAMAASSVAAAAGAFLSLDKID